MKAKTKLTKLWSILLAVVLVISMIPTVALATESATEKADFSTDPSAALSLLNAAKTGTEDSTWDPDTNTLTLNGVNFVTTASTAVRLPADSTIVLNGKNTVNGGSSNSEYCCGIDGLGNLTIKGTGTLNVTAGATTDDNSYGINSDYDLTIEGGTVNATGDTGYYSFGIYADNDIKISGGVITAIGGDSAETDSYGIDSESNLIIEGGTVTANGGTAEDDSYGLYAYYNVKISGGSVKATGGTATNGSSYGTRSDDDTYISGGTVTAEGGAADHSYGICAYDNVIIEGGIVSAKGGTATDGYSYGIRTIDLHIKISGGTVTAEGGAADYSYGTRSDDDTYISGGTITGTGGAADIKSYGIRTADYIYVSGGTATGLGGTAAEGSYGFYAYNYDVNISGGTVTAEGGAAANGSSLGIYADEDIIISDGTVIAKANTSALDYTPQALPSTYWWRTSNSGAYHKYPDSAYIWDAAHIYFEIQKPGYTVTFDANGGSGEMTGADVVSGEYTLPANGFTAPEGKQFKCWSVDGIEKAVGDKITVAADTTVKAVWENIPATPTPTEYEILDGANSSWTQNSDGSLSFRGNGAFSEFVGVKVDGILVDAKNYTVKEGSTIVTLNADYLNTLTAGNHTLEIVWTDGSASTAFTVNAKAVVDNETKSPQTGDNSMMALWIAVLFVSGFGVVAIAVYGKKRKSVK